MGHDISHRDREGADCQYLIPEALRAMFPMWAQGQMLDMHAANRGMERKAAQTAHVQVVFTGTEGAKAPRGTVVSTLPQAMSSP